MKSVFRKVFLIANSGFTVINFRFDLIKTLVDKGCCVTVLCPSDCALMIGRDIRNELANIGAKYIPIAISRSGINPIAEIRLLLTLINILRKEVPDVVLNYTVKPTIYASIAARLVGVKYIASNITGLGYVFTSDTCKARFLSIIIKAQYKIALRCNSLVFFQNPDDESEFESLSLIKSVKTKVINGSGIDVEKFQRGNIAAKPCSFVLVSRMLRDKGISEFIQAAELLKKKYPNTVFTLLGPIDESPNSYSIKELEEYVSKDVVQYLSARSDVRPVLEDHEVFVLPSYYREGIPRSILEAMSMSMPIITTDAPGCRETVVPDSNGFLVEPKSSHSLASAMENFIVNRDLVRLFGDASRALACQRFDVRKVNDSIVSEFL